MNTIKCNGCDRVHDACKLILHGIHDEHDLYCSMQCMPPPPKPANAFQWIRMQFGMWFITVDGTRYKFG